MTAPTANPTEELLALSRAEADALALVIAAQKQINELVRDLAGAREGSAYYVHLVALLAAEIVKSDTSFTAWATAAAEQRASFDRWLEWVGEVL